MVSEKEVREHLRRRAEYHNRLFNRYAKFLCSIFGETFFTADSIKQDLVKHFKDDPKEYEEIMLGFK